ncbi:hypothetical protein, partial [Xenorhabdus bovienii]|uniref:hypothetical protein n=1 Tax=Xenorhabdus bovienii TaxID=40576 RepID=UPI0023B25FF0
WDFFDLAINQIAKTGLSSLQVIYYFESLFSYNRGIYSAITRITLLFKFNALNSRLIIPYSQNKESISIDLTYYFE